VEPEVLQEYVSGFCADGSFSCAMAYYRGLRKDLRFIVRALRLNEPEGGFPETLILWGAQDPILPTSVGVMAHKDITGSLFQALPMAGHFVHSEAPDEVNPRLIDFLSDCS
jgi:pimeloyl-ACP methyl ester carboxylesterase